MFIKSRLDVQSTSFVLSRVKDMAVLNRGVISSHWFVPMWKSPMIFWSVRTCADRSISDDTSYLRDKYFVTITTYNLLLLFCSRMTKWEVVRSPCPVLYCSCGLLRSHCPRSHRPRSHRPRSHRPRSFVLVHTARVHTTGKTVEVVHWDRDLVGNATGRCRRMSAIYPRMQSYDAEFGVSMGFERPVYFRGRLGDLDPDVPTAMSAVNFAPAARTSRLSRVDHVCARLPFAFPLFRFSPLLCSLVARLLSSVCAMIPSVTGRSPCRWVTNPVLLNLDASTACHPV